MMSWQHITQTYLTICIHRLPLGTRLQSNRFCEQTELPVCFYSERLTSLKRNATNQLPMDLALPAILSQPTLVTAARSDPKSLSDDQGIKPQETIKKPSQAGYGKRKRWTKRSQRQESWSEHSSRSDQQSNRNSPKTASLFTTYPTVVTKPRQEKAAPRAFICAQSRGVSNPPRFKTIVEASQASPKAGLYKDSRSAKFLRWKFSLEQPG